MVPMMMMPMMPQLMMMMMMMSMKSLQSPLSNSSPLCLWRSRPGPLWSGLCPLALGCGAMWPVWPSSGLCLRGLWVWALALAPVSVPRTEYITFTFVTIVSVVLVGVPVRASARSGA